MTSRFKRSGRTCAILVASAASLLALAQSASAQVIDFEKLVASETMHGVDINNDGINDVLFSTTDPLGFGNGGPNPDTQLYASGLLLESSSTIDPDIRVDFRGGAIDLLQVGFALLTDVNDVDQGLTLEVFDQTGNQLVSASQRGELLPLNPSFDASVSGFPEGLVSLSFEGVASYALIDATTTGTRFVIDNFAGTFLPAAIPEPNALALLGLGGALALARRRRTR